MLARAIAIGLGALLLAGCGISGNFRQDLGYAAFGSPEALAEHREFGLSLGPTPLALARMFLDDEEPELGAILKELRAVRVYVYEGIPDGEHMVQHLRDIESGLLDDGWVAIAKVRDGTDRVSVLLRPDDNGRTHGMAVIVQEPTEVVLVNLIGNVRLDLFSEYMAELDVDTPRIDIDPQTLEARIR
jgi:hypothetical protein